MISGPLAERLEHAVLEIVMATNGTYQAPWGLWLTTVTGRVPELEQAADLVAAFKRLRESRLVKLTKPDTTQRDASEYSGNDADDNAFFFAGEFNVSITPRGRQRWDQIKTIGVKQAVAIAMEYLKTLMSGSVSNILLEEVSLSDDEKFWNVTLSAEVPVPDDSQLARGPLAVLTRSSTAHRVYKAFKIAAATGVVKSMTIMKP